MSGQPKTTGTTGAGAAGVLLHHIGDWLMLALALAMAWASFRAESDAYLFPRMVSALLLLFAAVNIVQSVRRHLARPAPPPVAAATLRLLLPAICIVAVYIYVCDIIGFYWSALPAYVLLAGFYGGRLDARGLRMLAVATALVMGGVVLLFDVLLQVQTPEPFWID